MFWYDDMKRAAKKISYKGRSGFCEVNPVQSKNGELFAFQIKVYIYTKDRITGEFTRVWKHYVILPDEIKRMTEELFVSRVRDVIHLLELHEADEQFLYNGRRVYDPHVLPQGTDIIKEKVEYLKDKRERMQKIKEEVVRQMNEYNEKKAAGDE